MKRQAHLGCCFSVIKEIGDYRKVIGLKKEYSVHPVSALKIPKQGEYCFVATFRFVFDLRQSSSLPFLTLRHLGRLLSIVFFFFNLHKTGVHSNSVELEDRAY
ncbi:MAG: hypothetical protein WCF23_23550 [Candidatus Nitrosopolaris sp.]